MRSSSKKLVVAAVCLLAAGALAAYAFVFLSQQETVAQVTLQVSKTDHVKEPSRKLGAEPGNAKPATAVARDGPPVGRSASEIYANVKLDSVKRFHSLMRLVQQGDAEARYLAYRMRENCRIAGAMSQDTVLPELWTAQMGHALKTLKKRCRPLAADPAFQDFSQQVKGLATASFDDEIPLRIKKAFANFGAKAAVSTALAAFRGRPDRATAGLVAKTLAGLDVLKYDPRFQLEGSAALFPAMRKETFYAALMLHSCDFGVPCGPGSARMLRICAIGGGCQPGQGLYQYFANTVSPRDMRNIQSVLDALRRAEP